MKLLWYYFLDFIYSLRIGAIGDRIHDLHGELAGCKRAQDLSIEKRRKIRSYIASHAPARWLLP